MLWVGELGIAVGFGLLWAWRNTAAARFGVTVGFGFVGFAGLLLI